MGCPPSLNGNGRAWRELSRNPVRVGRRLLASLIRQRIPALSRPIVAFPGGLIEADLNTAHGLGLYRYNRFDPSLGLVAARLSPGDVFVDAGANLGQFTLTGARRVGGQGRVFAFEAAPSTAQSLRRNVDLNGYRWVQVIEAALDELPGESSFVAFDGDQSGLSSFAPASPSQGQSLVVPAVRLDDAVPSSFWDRVKLIKIDVEGAEARVLRGGAQLIRSSRCEVLIEVESGHLNRQQATVSDVEELLRECGLRRSPQDVPHPNRLYIPI